MASSCLGPSLHLTPKKVHLQREAAAGLVLLRLPVRFYPFQAGGNGERCGPPRQIPDASPGPTFRFHLLFPRRARRPSIALRPGSVLWPQPPCWRKGVQQVLTAGKRGNSAGPTTSYPGSNTGWCGKQPASDEPEVTPWRHWHRRPQRRIWKKRRICDRTPTSGVQSAGKASCPGVAPPGPTEGRCPYVRPGKRKQQWQGRQQGLNDIFLGGRPGQAPTPSTRWDPRAKRLGAAREAFRGELQEKLASQAVSQDVGGRRPRRSISVVEVESGP